MKKAHQRVTKFSIAKFRLIVLLVLVISLMQLNTLCRSIRQTTFIKDSIRDVQKRIEDGCSREMPHYGDKFSCLSECGLDLSCIGASLEKSTGKCFFHEVCSPSTRYVRPDTNHDYFSRYCVHGRWKSGTSSCKCSFMTFGERCEKAYGHPQEYVGFGRTTPVVFIDPKQDGDLYRVKLNIRDAKNTSSIFLVKNDGVGVTFFNRTWNEYSNGFSEAGRYSYWIGLKAWNVLSRKDGCSLTTVVIAYDFAKISKAVRYYKNFVVRDRHDNYSFTFESSYSRTYGKQVTGNYSIGDCMKSVGNVSFSTWDMDNGALDDDDDVTQNCPSQVGSGWWHPRDCNNSCNFLGWALEDWDNAPPLQRFSVLGVDMSQAASQIRQFRMYLKCV